MSVGLEQPFLLLDDLKIESQQFLTEQLVTYIGNKRALLDPIENVAKLLERRLGRPLRVLDAFSGSGVVSRMMKSHASCVVANDLEPYAAVLSRCYLSNRSQVPWDRLRETVNEMNRVVDASASTDGFIERLYAPADDNRIRSGERAFFTHDNARRLDHYAQLILSGDDDLRPFLMGPLLSAASVHANTAGVFKGFYKDSVTGVGRFGGSGENALSRILGTIRLHLPVMSEFESEAEIHQRDANDLLDEIDAVDLAYFDPPYNQHPYGSNYFMLNLLVNYEEPTNISSVSGIPVDWQRSNYNVKSKSALLMLDLVARCRARFLLVSFNDEGFIPPGRMRAILESQGTVTEYRTTYNAFRGSRNLQGRSLHVTEHLYLVEKGV